MSTNTVQHEPTAPPWESLRPSDNHFRYILQRFPTLTATGFYTYERYERENDRACRFLPPSSLIPHDPPIPIDRPDVIEDIARVRFFLQSVTGRGSNVHTGQTLRRAISLWAKRDIWPGAVIAGAFLEDRIVNREGGRILVWVSLPAEIHFRIAADAATALAVVDGALACVPR